VTRKAQTLYIAAFALLAELSSPGATGQRWTIISASATAKLQCGDQTATATITTRYSTTDNLGSISVITTRAAWCRSACRMSLASGVSERHDDPTDIASHQRALTGEEEHSAQASFISTARFGAALGPAEPDPRAACGG